jgi:hypothetical protein
MRLRGPNGAWPRRRRRPVSTRQALRYWPAMLRGVDVLAQPRGRRVARRADVLVVVVDVLDAEVRIVDQ